MRNFLFVFLLLVGFLSASAHQARAQDGEHFYYCGPPQVEETVPEYAEHFKFCDYYQRRFDYRESAIKLKKQINTRRERFAEYGRMVREKYEADLKRHHDSLGEDSEW